MANYTREIAHMLDRLNTKILAQDKNGYYVKQLKVELNLAEVLLLKQLGESGSIKLNVLIKQLEVERNFLNTTLKRMATAKWIQKSADPEDRRGQIVSLLQPGRELYQELIKQQQLELDFVLNDITINEEKTILKFISKIVQYHTEKFEVK